MTVLTRYLITTYLLLFSIVLPGLSGLYFVIHAFERIDDLLEAKVSSATMFSYFFFLIPKICFEVAPLAMMLSGVLSLMLLSRHNELIAIRSIGIKPSRVVNPFLIITLFISFVMLAMQLFYVPRATARSENIWEKEVEKRSSKGVFLGDRLFYHGKKAIWTMKLASPDARLLEDVEWAAFDENYTIKEFVAAKKAKYSDKMWTFSQGVHQIYKGSDSPKADSILKGFEVLEMKLSERPEDFIAIKIPARWMDMFSLWKSIGRLKKAGYKTGDIEIHFWGNLLYPFLGISLLWLACPMILARGRGGLALGIALGIMLGLLGWLFWNAMLTLGRSGDFPVPFAVILVHAVLFGCGFILYKRMRF